MGNTPISSTVDPTRDAKLVQREGTVEYYEDSHGVQYEKHFITDALGSNIENEFRFRQSCSSEELVQVVFAGICLGIVGPVTGPFGCAQKGKYEVVTERMPYRLSHLSHLSRENYLLILSKAFKGFSQLYSTNGPFLVKEAMIGINFVGQVKVWPNENYAVNCAKADVRYRSESNMVRQIFALVAARADRTVAWDEFNNYWRQPEVLTFQTAIERVYRFAAVCNISLTDKLIDPFRKFNKQTDVKDTLLQVSQVAPVQTRGIGSTGKTGRILFPQLNKQQQNPPKHLLASVQTPMFRLTNNYWPVEPREEGALKGQKVTAREQPWQIRTEPPIPFIPYAANSNRFPNQDASHLPELRYENKTNNKLDNKSPINYQNTIHFRAASEGVNLLPTVLPVYDTVLNSKCNLDLSHQKSFRGEQVSKIEATYPSKPMSSLEHIEKFSRMVDEQLSLPQNRYIPTTTQINPEHPSSAQRYSLVKDSNEVDPSQLHKLPALQSNKASLREDMLPSTTSQEVVPKDQWAAKEFHITVQVVESDDDSIPEQKNNPYFQEMKNEGKTQTHLDGQCILLCEVEQASKSPIAQARIIFQQLAAIENSQTKVPCSVTHEPESITLQSQSAIQQLEQILPSRAMALSVMNDANQNIRVQLTQQSSVPQQQPKALQQLIVTQQQPSLKQATAPQQSSVPPQQPIPIRAQLLSYRDLRKLLQQQFARDR